MTRPDIDAIEKRAAAATEGEWVPAWPDGRVDVRTEHGTRIAAWLSEKDAQFVAFAKDDVPALCAYARELEATLVSLEWEGGYTQESGGNERSGKRCDLCDETMEPLCPSCGETKHSNNCRLNAIKIGSTLAVSK